MPIEKIMVFIDGSNIYKEADRFRKNYQVDYEKLVDILGKGRKLIRPYFYGSTLIKSTRESENFFDRLQYKGFKTIIKPIREIGEKRTEKGVDVALATDLLSLAYNNAYDTAILVTGDGDLCEVVRRVQALGKRVEVAFFRKSLAKSLIKECDGTTFLDEICEKIEFKEKGGR